MCPLQKQQMNTVFSSRVGVCEREREREREREKHEVSLIPRLSVIDKTHKEKICKQKERGGEKEVWSRLI